MIFLEFMQNNLHKKVPYVYVQLPSEQHVS